MKNVQIPPAVMYGISFVVLAVAALVLWLTVFKQPPPVDPRTLKPEEIIDPDPPRTRDMQPGRGGS